MERMKKIGKVLGIIVGVLVVAGACFFGWAKWTVASAADVQYEAHEVDFPVPFPLSEEEIEAIRQERIAELAAANPEPAADPEGETAEGETAEGETAEGETAEGETAEGETAEPAAPAVDPMEGVDLEAIALERAVERGEHLVTALYVCVECHGANFAGGTMVDDPMIGTLEGPNLTGGQGSRVADWTIAQWDRAVRHGILPPDGRASWMPAEDYQRMSDHELSDVIAYIRSLPAVDHQAAAPVLGPLGTVLAATGQLIASVNRIHDHQSAHLVHPPAAGPTAEYGEHLSGICTGCHREELNGGPIAAGPPDWLPARNLTPDASGLEGWTYDDFQTAMRDMRRPDGTELGMPMTLMRQYTANMTEVELQALWAYLQTLEPTPTGT